MPENPFLEMFRWGAEHSLAQKQQALREKQLTQDEAYRRDAMAEQVRQFMAANALDQQKLDITRSMSEAEQRQVVLKGIADGSFRLPNDGPAVTGTAAPSQLPIQSEEGGQLAVPSMATPTPVAPAFVESDKAVDLGAGMRGLVVPHAQRIAEEAAAMGAVKRQQSWLDSLHSRDIAKKLFGFSEGSPEFLEMTTGMKAPKDFQELMASMITKQAKDDPKQFWPLLNTTLKNYYTAASGVLGPAEAMRVMVATKQMVTDRAAEFYRNKILSEMHSTLSDPEFAKEYALRVQEHAQRGEFGNPEQTREVVASLSSLQAKETKPAGPYNTRENLLDTIKKLSEMQQQKQKQAAPKKQKVFDPETGKLE